VICYALVVINFCYVNYVTYIYAFIFLKDLRYGIFPLLICVAIANIYALSVCAAV